MAYPSECVTDANIWIDLDTGGLLPEAFRLPWRWIIPDIIIARLKQPDPNALRKRGLKEVELGGDEVAQVPGLAARYAKPSREDLFALVLAKSKGTTLLTGDGNLRAAAEQEGVDVHGTLWVLDEMVRQKIVKSSRAADALERMVRESRRLPQEEVEKRLRSWRSAGG